MSMRRASWGVDLTGGAIKAVRVERSGPTFQITEALEIPWSDPSQPMRAGFKLQARAKAALRPFFQETAHALGDPVFIGLPGYGIRQGQLVLPDVDRARRDELLRYELAQTLTDSVNDWEVRLDERGRTHRDGISYVALRRDHVDAFHAELERAGLPVDGLMPEGVALARYLEVEWAGPDRRLAIQVQRTRTDFVFLTPKGFRTRSVPIGVGALRGFAAGSRNPPQDQVRSLADRIAAELERIELHVFGARGNFAPERAVLLGDGASIRPLLTLLTRRLGIDVTPLPPNRKVRLGSSATGSAALDAPQMGTAIGLALSALASDGEPISFCEPPRERRNDRRRPMLAAALLLVTLGLFAVRWVAGSHAASVDALDVAMSHDDAWSRHEALRAARLVGSQAESERNARLWSVVALRRQSELPGLILAALDDPSTYLRFLSLSVEPGRHRDAFTLRVRVPKRHDLPDPVALVRTWTTRQLHFEAGDIAVDEEESRWWVIRIQGQTPDRRA